MERKMFWMTCLILLVGMLLMDRLCIVYAHCNADSSKGVVLGYYKNVPIYSNGVNQSTPNGRNQCVDLVKRFYSCVYKIASFDADVWPLGDAFTYADSRAMQRRGFNFYPNRGSVKPAVDNIIAFLNSGVGHVGIVVEVTDDKVVTVNQNLGTSGSPTTLVTLALRKVFFKPEPWAFYYEVEDMADGSLRTAGWSRLMYEIAIYASGEPARGINPRMVLKVNGTQQALWDVGPEGSIYSTKAAIASGDTITVEFTNDYFNLWPREDRNLIVYHIRIGSVTIPTTDPSIVYERLGQITISAQPQMKWNGALKFTYKGASEIRGAGTLGNQVVLNDPAPALQPTPTPIPVPSPPLPNLGSFRSLPGMPQNRVSMGACALNGKIYVFGGMKDGSGWNISNEVEEYNPQTNQWRKVASMPSPRAFHIACTVNGKVYLIGGQGPGTIPQTVDEFTPPPANAAPEYSAGTDGVISGPHSVIPSEALAESRDLINNTKLFQNYPNPFNPETWIPYQLKDTAQVTIRIYDSAGRSIRLLNLGPKERGVYLSKDDAAYFDGRDQNGNLAPSGVYFYTIEAVPTQGGAGAYTATKKLIIVK